MRVLVRYEKESSRGISIEPVVEMHYSLKEDDVYLFINGNKVHLPDENKTIPEIVESKVEQILEWMTAGGTDTTKYLDLRPERLIMEDGIES